MYVCMYVWMLFHSTGQTVKATGLKFCTDNREPRKGDIGYLTFRKPTWKALKFWKPTLFSPKSDFFKFSRQKVRPSLSGEAFIYSPCIYTDVTVYVDTKTATAVNFNNVL